MHFSELDFQAAWSSSEIVASDKAHADAVYCLLFHTLPEANVKRLGFWGLLDTEHQFRIDTTSGYYDPDARPTLFAEVSEPKLVFHHLAGLLGEQTAR